MILNKIFKSILIYSCILLINLSAKAQNDIPNNTINTAVQKAALAYLDSVQTLSQSSYWVNVKPTIFLQNLKRNVQFPLQINTGRGTNFCAFAAVSYTCLLNEPLRYVQCMVTLYNNGEAYYRKVHLQPSSAILHAAGLIQFSGDLDNNPAEQIWFLTLANDFKCYLNWFNMKYEPGDENTRWAASSLHKFNRILRQLCKYKTYSKGSDLLLLNKASIVSTLQSKLQIGEVYLYLNNGLLRKKNHAKYKRLLPTHFVVLQKIYLDTNTNTITLQYWDGGYITIKEVAFKTFQKILYGYTYTKKNENSTP